MFLIGIGVIFFLLVVMISFVIVILLILYYILKGDIDDVIIIELIIIVGGENIVSVFIEDIVKECFFCVFNCILIGDKRKFLFMFIILKV